MEGQIILFPQALTIKCILDIEQDIYKILYQIVASAVRITSVFSFCWASKKLEIYRSVTCT